MASEPFVFGWTEQEKQTLARIDEDLKEIVASVDKNKAQNDDAAAVKEVLEGILKLLSLLELFGGLSDETHKKIGAMKHQVAAFQTEMNDVR